MFLYKNKNVEIYVRELHLKRKFEADIVTEMNPRNSRHNENLNSSSIVKKKTH